MCVHICANIIYVLSHKVKGIDICSYQLIKNVNKCIKSPLIKTPFNYSIKQVHHHVIIFSNDHFYRNLRRVMVCFSHNIKQ